MTIFPNAKINLGLNIVSKRADGYHGIETVFLPIGLCDEIEIECRADSRIALESDGIRLDCDDENNLIVRVCRMFQQEKHIGGVSIRLNKHIPFGAGLGGGSSDATHTAMALNEIFCLGMTKQEIKEMVSRLGADCAFFVENKPCFAEGIGDILTPINLSLHGYHIVLIKPDVSVSTKEAYAGVTAKEPAVSIKEIIKRPVEEWKVLLKNDFEESVFRAHPEIEAAKQGLYDMGAVYACMSGSGASVYGLFTSSPVLHASQSEYSAHIAYISAM